MEFFALSHPFLPFLCKLLKPVRCFICYEPDKFYTGKHSVQIDIFVVLKETIHNQKVLHCYNRFYIELCRKLVFDANTQTVKSKIGCCWQNSNPNLLRIGKDSSKSSYSDPDPDIFCLGNIGPLSFEFGSFKAEDSID